MITSNIHYGVSAFASGPVTAGQPCSNAGNVYRATNSGTASVAPTHTSGTVTGADGVSWRFLSTYDYTSVTSWWAGVPATMTDNVTGQIWNHGEILDPNGYDTCFVFDARDGTDGRNGTYRATLTAAPGESYCDRDGSATALGYDPTKGVAIRKSTPYNNLSTNGAYGNGVTLTVSRLQLAVTGATSNISHTYGDTLVDQCLLVFGTNAYPTGYFAGGWRNTIAICTMSATSYMIRFNQPRDVVNCTFQVPANKSAGCAPLAQVYNTPNLQGCAFIGFPSHPSGSFSGNNNATSLSTDIPGTTNTTKNVPNTTATFVQPSDATALDLRLVSGSALRGLAPTDTTRVPSGADFFGYTRSTPWDAGAVQYQSGGGGGPPPAIRPRIQRIGF